MDLIVERITKRPTYVRVLHNVTSYSCSSNLQKCSSTLTVPSVCYVWQQGPASFNITAKTDVCTLPINVPKLIIAYVTYYCLKLSNISTLMATGSGQHGKHCSLSTAELCARHNYYEIPFSHINYYLQFVNVKLL